MCRLKPSIVAGLSVQHAGDAAGKKCLPKFMHIQAMGRPLKLVGLLGVVEAPLANFTEGAGILHGKYQVESQGWLLVCRRWAARRTW